jgi:hypothetical protein
MAATPMTLSEYLRDEQVPMLVEHRCGRSLGVHEVCVVRGIGGPAVGTVDITKVTRPHRSGAITTPGVMTRFRRDPGMAAVRWYAQVSCTCLPAGHIEKLGIEKVGSLPVKFPEQKWGRHIDLPVVTI